jgi:hypothetical protein
MPEAVARSVSDIYKRDTAERVVQRLSEWTDGNAHDGQRVAAVGAFLRLARNERPPWLFDLLEDSAAEAVFARLWLLALRWGIRGGRQARTPEAWDVLAEWFHNWKLHPGVRRVLRNVAADGDDTVLQHLRFHLWIWTRQGRIDANIKNDLAPLL